MPGFEAFVRGLFPDLDAPTSSTEVRPVSSNPCRDVSNIVKDAGPIAVQYKFIRVYEH